MRSPPSSAEADTTTMESEPPTSSRDDRRLAALAHAGGPLGLLLSAGLLGFVIPLAVWIAKRDTSSFVEDQGREALNFQITLLLLHVAGWLFVLLTLGLGFLVVLPAFLVLWVVELVLGILAAVRALDGERYRYPLALRLL